MEKIGLFLTPVFQSFLKKRKKSRCTRRIGCTCKKFFRFFQELGSDFGDFSPFIMKAYLTPEHNGNKKAIIRCCHFLLSSVITCRGNYAAADGIQNRKDMKTMLKSTCMNYDELPIFLNARMIANVLGISPTRTYELMNEKGFPKLRVGNRIVVPREKFLAWLEENITED